MILDHKVLKSVRLLNNVLNDECSSHFHPIFIAMKYDQQKQSNCFFLMIVGTCTIVNINDDNDDKL